MSTFNQTTGMSEDYMNAWGFLNFLHFTFKEGNIPEEKFFQILAQPIDQYKAYFKKYYPHKAQEAMQRADPESLKKLDDLVEKYNKLSPREKMDHRVYSRYIDECLAIINDQTTE